MSYTVTTVGATDSTGYEPVRLSNGTLVISLAPYVTGTDNTELWASIDDGANWTKLANSPFTPWYAAGNLRMAVVPTTDDIVMVNSQNGAKCAIRLSGSGTYTASQDIITGYPTGAARVAAYRSGQYTTVLAGGVNWSRDASQAHFDTGIKLYDHTGSAWVTPTGIDFTTGNVGGGGGDLCVDPSTGVMWLIYMRANGACGYYKATITGTSFTWSGGADAYNDGSGSNGRSLKCCHDGTYFLAALNLLNNQNVVKVAQVDGAGAVTTFTAPTFTPRSGYVPFIGGITADAYGNFHILLEEDGGTTADSAHLWVNSYDRGSATWGTWTKVTSAAQAAAQSYVSVGLRAPINTLNKIDFFAGQRHAGSTPNDALFGTQALNVAPNAPTLTSLTNGETVDLAATNRASHIFSDPDVGDSQSGFDHRYRIVGAPSWTTALASTTNQYVDYPAGTFAAGDYERQVRTYDAQGLVGPWSASGFFTAADRPDTPSITAPVNGATITSSSEAVTWSTASQEAYQLQVLDGGTVVTDTGTVVSSVIRSATLAFPTNGVTRTIQLRVRNGGLWSSWYAITVSVSYTSPATPSFTLLPDDATASIGVAISNPTPGAGEPSVTSNEVYITDPDKSEERRAVVAPNGSWTYRTPAGDTAGLIDYSSRVRVVAIGDNGTTTSS